jgi:hypothetical protein
MGMLMRSAKLLLCSFAVLALAGCKADSVELKISEGDVMAALKGKEVSVPFEAVFSNPGPQTDDKKAQLEAIGKILTSHMQIDDFEVENVDDGFVVKIAGEIPVVATKSNSMPYYVSVGRSETIPGFAQVQVATGSDFERMQSDVQSISYSLAPDAFHPTTINFEAEDKRIVAPAVEVDGDTFLLLDTKVHKRISLHYSGGPYEQVGAGFFMQTE